MNLLIVLGFLAEAILECRDMDGKTLSQIKAVFKAQPAVKLAYFFGSRAEGLGGPLSDYDFAVYADEKDSKKLFTLRSELMDKLGRLLKTDGVDLVLLNTAEGAELKFNIIAHGRLIFERGHFRVLVEPRIMNEYFDFREMLMRHKLTGTRRVIA